MKKLLLLTLITTTFLQAEEEMPLEDRMKQKICSAYAQEIYDHGIYPCKKGDIFQQLGYDQKHPANNMYTMLRVCELGTISGRNCILRDQKDFIHEVDHSTYLRDKKIVK